MRRPLNLASALGALSGAYVRFLPDPSSPIIGVLERGDRVERSENQGSKQAAE
jgi:hypothetical protein